MRATLGSLWGVRSARAALVVLAAVAVLAVAGGALAPADPLAQNPADLLRGPSGGHLLGTDYLGRDVLARLLTGTRASVVGALEAVGVATALGVVPGVASVWLGRGVEWTALRCVDALMTLPFTVFAIAVVGALGNGMQQAMLALGVLFAPLYFRVTRAATLGLKQAQYVEAAELMGASRRWILRRHIWGKILPTVAVTTAHAVGQALLVVASLTFLGLGVQPPAPTWGGMLAADLGYLAQQPWAPLLPAAVIMLTVGALNLLADAVRDTGQRPEPPGPRTAPPAPPDRPAPAPPRTPPHPSRARSRPMTQSASRDHRDPSTVLSVRDLAVTVGHGRVRAVRGVSFTVGRGESVGLVGESGSGKSLTCRAVLGLLPPGCEVAEGSAELEGTGLTGLSRRQWDGVRGRRLGAVFQDPASYLNPSLTVGRQLAEQLRVGLALSRERAHARAVELFGAVGLRGPTEVFHRYPHELSGGMLQRVLIAIAVSCDPELLIADEATTALDVVVQAEILELLRQARTAGGLALLLVTHDLAVVAETCDRVMVMYAGEIVEDGPTAEVLAAPAHPYTEALLKVASLGDWERRELAVIPGRPPEPGAELSGCRFADRCGYAVDACTAGPVPLTKVGERHVSRCLRTADREPARPASGSGSGPGSTSEPASPTSASSAAVPAADSVTPPASASASVGASA